MQNNYVRRLKLENANNIRDLGGYYGNGGKTTVWGKLYRADSLVNLNEADCKILEKRNIKTIVDLRSGTEKKAAPDVIPNGAKYFHCPVQRLEVNLDGSAVTEFKHSLSESYEKILSETCDLFSDALKTIIEGFENGAVLFHCSAGKDRTGVTAATILYLLGVSEEDIVADYQVSGTYNKNGINKLLVNLPNFKELEPILSSAPENLEPLFGFFRTNNLKEHLAANGLDEKYIETLEKQMLERTLFL